MPRGGRQLVHGDSRVAVCAGSVEAEGEGKASGLGGDMMVIRAWW